MQQIKWKYEEQRNKAWHGNLNMDEWPQGVLLSEKPFTEGDQVQMHLQKEVMIWEETKKKEQAQLELEKQNHKTEWEKKWALERAEERDLLNAQFVIKEMGAKLVEKENKLKHDYEVMFDIVLKEKGFLLEKKAVKETEQKLLEMEKQIEIQAAKLEEEKEHMAKVFPQINKGPIKINVGGKIFQTTLSTLKKYDTMLQAMFSGRYELEKDSDGAYFIDRDGTHFHHILNFMRDGILPDGLPELTKASPKIRSQFLPIFGTYTST